MDILAIVVTIGVSFLMLLFNTELQKLVRVIRKKPYESFTVVGLSIVILGVVKMAFLPGG